MNSLGFKKLSSLTGLISVILMILGAIIFGVFDYLPLEERSKAIFSENSAGVLIAGYIHILSAFFLIWFAGTLYNFLHKREGNAVHLSILSFGGGLGSGIAMLIGYSIIVAGAARASESSGITSLEAIILYDLYSHILGQMFAVTLAVFVGSTGVITLRTGLFPSWFGWASVIIALGLLTPIGYIVVSLVLLWLFIISIWLYRRVTTSDSN